MVWEYFQAARGRLRYT